MICCARVETAWRNEVTELPIIVRVFECEGWSRKIDESPLHKRGWVLQERLLSPRLLYFTRAQILFECDIHKRCEVFQDQVSFHYTLSINNSRVFSWITSDLEAKVQSGQNLISHLSAKGCLNYGCTLCSSTLSAV